MRLLLFVITSLAAAGEPLPWAAFPAELIRLLREGGLQESTYPNWQEQQRQRARIRLAEGTAEHITYFLLQTRTLGPDTPLDPAAEARRYFGALPPAERKAFLAGALPQTALPLPIRQRMDAFWTTQPTGERHKVLRRMGQSLGWQPDRVVLTAFRFLMQRSSGADANELYQERGLSADPFPPSMRAVELGLAHVAARASVLLAGPGAELGSRFGVNDALPVQSPQPKVLAELVGKGLARFDCVDIRPEVVDSLAGGPCHASLGNLVTDRLPAARYDLAVATNLLVYLSDQELAVAMGNIAQALRPGGCLLHNDDRFAARLFGEAAGIPVKHFQSVSLGTRNGREQRDRVVVHCKTAPQP